MKSLNNGAAHCSKAIGHNSEPAPEPDGNNCDQGNSSGGAPNKELPGFDTRSEGIRWRINPKSKVNHGFECGHNEEYR